MGLDHFVVETDPSCEDVRFLEDRLYEYNVTQTGVDDRQWLAIFLRDDQQTIQAPAFYQKLGYEVFAVLDEHPRSHQHAHWHKW